jgi:hypothetical protein
MCLPRVGASLGRLTPLILPMANTQMMSLFLAHVAEEFAGYFIVMLLAPHRLA